MSVSTKKHEVNVGGINRVISVDNSALCQAMFENILQNRNQLSNAEYNQIMSILQNQGCKIKNHT